MLRLDAFLRDFTSFNQTALSGTTLGLVLLPALLGYYVMAVLVQLRRTKLLRAALLPLVLWFSARSVMIVDFSGQRPEKAMANYPLAVTMTSFALRAIAWTLVDQPYIRLSVSGIDITRSEGTSFLSDLRSALWNACDLCCNCRGLGWNWSQGVRFPSPVVETNSRLVFVGLSLGRLILYLTIMAGLGLPLCSIAHPTPGGWSIFDPSLSPMWRYLRSTLATCLCGLIGCLSIDAGYQLQAILFTSLLQQRPQQWPPLSDQPWFSTSLTHFWGQGWHQLLRESFVAVGVKPLNHILGKYSSLGAFVVSAVHHDVAMRAMGPGGSNVSVFGFFVMQGVGVVLERLWTRLTGRAVGGVLGWVWVWVWLTVWGQFLVDLWLHKLFVMKAVYGVYTSSGLLKNAL